MCVCVCVCMYVYVHVEQQPIQGSSCTCMAADLTEVPLSICNNRNLCILVLQLFPQGIKLQTPNDTNKDEN